MANLSSLLLFLRSGQMRVEKVWQIINMRINFFVVLTINNLTLFNLYNYEDRIQMGCLQRVLVPTLQARLL